MEGFFLLRAPAFLLFLFVVAVLDAKTGTVPLAVFAAGILSGSVLSLLAGSMKGAELLWSFLPGGLMILAAFLSKQAIGFGDGAAFLAIGSFLGLWNTIFLLLTALCLSAVYSIGLLLVKKSNRGKMLPFLPFVLAGYIVFLSLL